MSGSCVPQEDSAALLELTSTTLPKHFRRALDYWSIEIDANVGRSLFHMATDRGSVTNCYLCAST